MSRRGNRLIIVNRKGLFIKKAMCLLMIMILAFEITACDSSEDHSNLYEGTWVGILDTVVLNSDGEAKIISDDDSCATYTWEVRRADDIDIIVLTSETSKEKKLEVSNEHGKTVLVPQTGLSVTYYKESDYEEMNETFFDKLVQFDDSNSLHIGGKKVMGEQFSVICLLEFDHSNIIFESAIYNYLKTICSAVIDTYDDCNSFGITVFTGKERGIINVSKEFGTQMDIDVPSYAPYSQDIEDLPQETRERVQNAIDQIDSEIKALLNNVTDLSFN